MRTAIGRIAGPLRPPTTFEIFGRRVSTSIAIARNVLTSDTASAPASSAALRERRDVGDVRRQLRDDRQPRHLAHRADDVEGAGEAAAELDAAFLDVRAGDVQLDGARRLRRPTASRDTSTYSSSVVPQTLTMTVARAGAQLRQLLVDEPVHADALQADRVQHARPASRRCRGGGCPSRSARNSPFDGDAAERRQIDDVGVLDAVAEAAARRDQRVLERQRADAERSRSIEITTRRLMPIVSPTVSDPPPAPAPRGTIARDGSAPSSPRIGTTQL